jgi:hypothetical protein
MPDALDALPLGTVVAIGNPANGRLAVRGEDGWRVLTRPGAPLVDRGDFRAGWVVCNPPPAEPVKVSPPPYDLLGMGGRNTHAQAAEEALAGLEDVDSDPDYLLRLAEVHARLAVAEEVHDLRVQLADELRIVAEAIDIAAVAVAAAGEDVR